MLKYKCVKLSWIVVLLKVFPDVSYDMYNMYTCYMGITLNNIYIVCVIQLF